MADTIIIEGLPLLRAKLAEAGALATPALAAAGLEEMEKVMTEAKAETPVDTGTLRDSGHVLPPKVSPTSVEIEAGFGGAASAYAIAVHEHPSAHDPPSWQGSDVSFTSGGPKFLERPFLAALPEIGVRLAAGVRAALSRLAI